MKKYPPYSIVWSPLPPITWIVPFIGHTGLVDSRGVVHDFQGSYSVVEGQMAFGDGTKYLQLPVTADWDDKIRRADEIYSERVHKLVLDNCHSHCCQAYGGNMVQLAWKMFWFGKYLSVGDWFKTNMPFLILISVLLMVSLLT